MREKEKQATEKPWEKPGDYLKAAETSMEGNYNMVGDGIINNTPPPGDDLTDGQTWDEMRNLAPETLPEAKQEEKLSVAAFLKSPQERVPASAEKKQPRHGMDREP